MDTWVTDPRVRSKSECKFVTSRRFQDELEESVNSLEMPCVVFGEPPTLVITTEGALYRQQLDAPVMWPSIHLQVFPGFPS